MYGENAGIAALKISIGRRADNLGQLHAIGLPKIKKRSSASSQGAFHFKSYLGFSIQWY